MDSTITYVLIAVIIGVASGLIFFTFYKKTLKSERETIERDRERILEDAKRDAETLKKEAAVSAKDLAYQAKVEAEKEIRERTRELNQLDKRETIRGTVRKEARPARAQGT